MTFSIGSTWRWQTWVYRFWWRDEPRIQRTLNKWISMVSLMTFADRVVVEDSALRIDTTGARTWIKTLGANTGKVLRTVIVEQTLRIH